MCESCNKLTTKWIKPWECVISMTDMTIEMTHSQGLIEPSNSLWRSLILLMKKNVGTWRFYIDYRRLKKTLLPITMHWWHTSFLSGVKWFSTLDLRSGYWHVEMDSSIKKNFHSQLSFCCSVELEHAFYYEPCPLTTENWLWQFKVMPFGLCSAPATFEWTMFYQVFVPL